MFSIYEVKNEWRYTPPLPHMSAWHGTWLSTRDNFTFTIQMLTEELNKCEILSQIWTWKKVFAKVVLKNLSSQQNVGGKEIFSDLSDQCWKNLTFWKK
jgi:hypothetical protein